MTGWLYLHQSRTQNSCGFDASEHEYSSMSRHGRKVPTSFYHRFTVDARVFADRYAQGRLVSVLEGGYSDMALTSGAMAHLCGLADAGKGKVDERWWQLENLEKVVPRSRALSRSRSLTVTCWLQLEKATKKRRGGKQSLTPQGTNESWLDRAVVIFSSLDAGSAQYMAQASSLRPAVSIPPSSMTLRERKKLSGLGLSVGNSDLPTPGSSQIENLVNSSESVAVPKKLPRVILRMGPPPAAPST